VTRLYYDIVKDIPDTLPAIEEALVKSTGLNLLGLAARAANVSAGAAAAAIMFYKATVVPVTSGQGVIPGFTGAVAAILNHIGLQSCVTSETDIGGIGDAYKKKADLLFAADDRKFLAFNLKRMTVSDNSQATAAGFVHALAAAAEKRSCGLEDRDVLVLGLGPVGTHAVAELIKLKARVIVYDTNEERLRTFAESNKDVTKAGSLKEALDNTGYVLDATPSSGIIDIDLIKDHTIISCPGVPHGLTPAAAEMAGPAFIHDNLPLGVAVMAAQSIFKSGD